MGALRLARYQRLHDQPRGGLRQPARRRELVLRRPAERYLDAQRAAHLQRMRELTELRRTGGVVDSLLAEHGLFHLEADLRWIDVTAARLETLAEAVGR